MTDGPMTEAADVPPFGEPELVRPPRAAASNGRDNGTDGPVDEDRIRRAVREILVAIGEDPDRDGLQDTPARVARMYAEMFAGLREEPDQHLQVMFEANHDEMVMVRDIAMTSMCEHHLVPFIGKAHVAYIPNDDGRVTGPVEAGPPGRRATPSARRCRSGSPRRSPTRSSARCSPKGVLVVIEAEHLCMSMRGRAQAGSRPRSPRRCAACSATTPRPASRPCASSTAAGPDLPPPIQLAAPGDTWCPKCSRVRRVMGVLNVTPDSFSDGGRWSRARRGDRARASSGRRGRGDRSTSVASRPARVPSRCPTTRSCGGCCR